MPFAKVGVTHTPQAYVLNTQHCLGTLFASSVAANQANTAIIGFLPLACNVKIAKIAVSISAQDAGLAAAFNVVVNTPAQLNGTQAYTQGVIAANDNSYTGPSLGVNYNQPNIGTASAGGTGFPTNIAGGPNVALPVALLSADYVFSAANGFSATGGSAIIIPPSYDAVYAAGSVLTLRASTVVTTGSITNLFVSVWGEIIGLRAGPVPSSTYYQATPGVDF